MRQNLCNPHSRTKQEQDQTSLSKMARKKNKESYAVLEGHRLAQPTIYSFWLVGFCNERVYHKISLSQPGQKHMFERQVTALSGRSSSRASMTCRRLKISCLQTVVVVTNLT